MPRPSCGVNIPGGTPSATAIVTGVAAATFTIASAAATIASIVKAGSAAAAPYPLVAAAAAGIVIVAVVIYFAVERCNQNPGGMDGCMAGVIEQIIPAFTGSTGDAVFAFSSQHDRVDVVVKSAYWDFIEPRSEYVFCSQNDNSPMVPCFYYNPAVCNAGIGASVGAGVGVVAGLLIAAAAVAAIGCATWILCILALLVAIIIVVAAAIIGALAGGEIGKAATPTQGPMSSGNQIIPSQPLEVGDYMTAQGNLAKYGDFNNALVFYFVKNTTLHGHLINHTSYSFTDPDTNLQPDACPVVQAPIQ
jgi:hypothetical protein